MRDELSSLSLVLILVGMDPTTPEDLQTEVRKACDSLASAMTPSHELATCSKIVEFGKTLSPANQSLLISFIPSTSPATVRMARCVSRALLLGAAPSAAEYENDLPELGPLIDLLSPPSGSEGPFDIAGNSNKKGFFDDLTSRLSLVSKALSDVDEYAIVEKRAMDEAKKPVGKKAQSDMDPKQEGGDDDEEEKKPSKMTPLEQVKRALDILHGKIGAYIASRALIQAWGH